LYFYFVLEEAADFEHYISFVAFNGLYFAICSPNAADITCRSIATMRSSESETCNASSLGRNSLSDDRARANR
jgi:hypothetical protein